ncbi:MAG: fumarylacetoacetase [Candidatus Dormiibacterota bacterium]
MAAPPASPFPVQNLPYGAFSDGDEPARVGVAVGSWVLDLSRLDVPHAADFALPSLNRFMARGRAAWEAVRRRLTELLTTSEARPQVEPHLIPQTEVRLQLPFEVADYVDFYSSEHHARNAGRIFRPSGEPLLPNWRHLPVGYHGRAGTVVISGTAVVRPRGQRLEPGNTEPRFGPTQRLDVEAEVGFVVGAPSSPGSSVPAGAFADHVFGAVLVNDWSARDIQAWEAAPLGPFLSKSFATSISPWVVPLPALAAARVQPPPQDPEPLAYLRDPDPWALDIALAVSWNGTVVSRPNFREMYWTPGQQLAHLTVNGARLRTGDLLASGTVSGAIPEQWGSFLELTWNGQQPVALADGSTRCFLEDGDTVSISGTAPGLGGSRIGFGAVAGTILPAPGDPQQFET